MSSMLLAAVTAHVDARGGGQGLFPTPMDQVNIVQSFQAMMPMRQIYRPSLCVVLRGAKEMMLGESKLNYGAMECLFVSVEVPALGRIVEASPEAPYLGITIELDVVVLREVLEQMDAPPAPAVESAPCAFVGHVDERLADCMVRLVRLSETPGAVPILYPSIMREVYYWLLSGPHGGELCALALPGSGIGQVVKAIQLLHADFTRTLRMEELAEAAGMSLSSFHRRFKELTSMTPLQFQKQMRLLEARRLMVSEAANVAEAAYRVGYESASQFSREYSRTFGIAPKRDALEQQRLLALTLRGAPDRNVA